MRKMILSFGLLLNSLTVMAADMSNGANNFYTSDKVSVQKITFDNQYKMNVPAARYINWMPIPIRSSASSMISTVPPEANTPPKASRPSSPRTRR